MSLARQWGTRAFAVCFLLFATLFVPLAPALAAPMRPTDTTTQQVVRLDSPAVVRIITQYFGSLTCIGCYADGTDVTFPIDGGTYDSGVAASGSGAFISPDGYIMTADHVVADSNDVSIDQGIEAAAIADYAKQVGTTIADATATFQANQGSITFKHTLKTNVFFSTPYTGKFQSVSDVKEYPMQSIAAQSPVDLQDTAIIKITVQDMPFLTLAATNATNVGDTVTAIAFPGDADVNQDTFGPLLNPSTSDPNTLNSLLMPSVNTGQVTSEKTDSAGTQIYQTTDIGYQGSSGGPVIDQHGKIVGFVDRGSAATDSTRVVYLIASPTIAQYIGQAGVPAKPSSTFMALWTRLNADVNSTSQCHWTNAKNDLAALQSVKGDFNGDTAVAQLIPANTPATCSVAPSTTTIAAIAGGIIVLLALLGLGIFLLRRNREKAIIPAYAVPGAPIQSSTPYPYGYPPSGPTQQQPGYPASAPPQQPYGYPPSGPQQGYAPSQQPQQPSYGYPPSMPTPQYGYAPNTPPYGATPDAQPVYPSQQPAAAPHARSAPQQPDANLPPSSPYAQARHCPNGHLVTNPAAEYCPECGTRLS